MLNYLWIIVIILLIQIEIIVETMYVGMLNKVIIKTKYQ